MLETTDWSQLCLGFYTAEMHNIWPLLSVGLDLSPSIRVQLSFIKEKTKKQNVVFSSTLSFAHGSSKNQLLFVHIQTRTLVAG